MPRLSEANIRAVLELLGQNAVDPTRFLFEALPNQQNVVINLANLEPPTKYGANFGASNPLAIDFVSGSTDPVPKGKIRVIRSVQYTTTGGITDDLLLATGILPSATAIQAVLLETINVNLEPPDFRWIPMTKGQTQGIPAVAIASLLPILLYEDEFLIVRNTGSGIRSVTLGYFGEEFFVGCRPTL